MKHFSMKENIHSGIFHLLYRGVKRSDFDTVSFTLDLHFKDPTKILNSWQLRQVTAQMSSQHGSHGKGTVLHFSLSNI